MNKLVRELSKLGIGMGLMCLPISQAAAQTATSAAPAATTNATATPVPPPNVPAATEQMAPIIVTGSLIPTTDTEGASPVITIDSATIEKRAYQTAEDILHDLPANGSFSSPGTTSGNFAAGAAYVSLRGLGPQATLVLINGRRVTDYAAPANGQYGFVDLNSIPAAIIDRVEVLTNGSALYGADAVAGVVNIITKKDIGTENGEIDTYIGNTTNKDAFEQRYSLMGSLSSFDKNGYGLVEADYEHQNSIFAGDRAISQSADQSANGGFNLQSGRTYPGQFMSEGSGDFFSILPGTGNVPLTGTTHATDHHVDDGASTVSQGFDYNPYTSIVPETERYGVYANYTYKFYDGNVTPNIDFDYHHNRTIFTQAPAGWEQGDGIGTNPNTEAVFTVPKDNPYNKTHQIIDILSYRFTDLGPRIEEVDGDTFRAVPSVDFKLGDSWTLNTGFNYNYSFLNDRNVGFPSANNFQTALNQTDPTKAYNPFTSAGGNSPSVLNSLLATTYNRDTTSIIGEDFRFNGSLFDLPAGPVQMAFGGEYRLERYDQTYSNEDQSGDILSSTVQLDTTASRKALSGYTEVDIPLTSPAFNCPGFYATDVYVAGRVDKYSEFGSTENPQVRLRWETVPGLVVRGSYSTAFRAPSLPELFAGGNQAVVFILDPKDGNFKDVTVNGGGNPNLKPETAEIFSGGVAYSPQFAKGLLLTADFFKIRYTNQIQQQDPQTLIDEGSSQVVHNPDGTVASVTATYSNLSSTVVQGIDWGVNYVIGDPDQNWGQLSFILNGTWILDYISDNGTGAQDLVGQDSGGLGGYARYRQDSMLTWDYRGFELNVSNNYTSGYDDSVAVADGLPFRTVASVVTFDLQASYTFDRDVDKVAPAPHSGGFDWRGIVAGTKFTVGCNNVYDFTPPFSANPSEPLGYDSSYADPTGRFIYGAIKKSF